MHIDRGSCQAACLAWLQIDEEVKAMKKYAQGKALQLAAAVTLAVVGVSYEASASASAQESWGGRTKPYKLRDL